jgi:hypothetical protein
MISDFRRWVRIKEDRGEEVEPDLEHPFVDSRHAHPEQRIIEILANRLEPCSQRHIKGKTFDFYALHG